MKAYCPPVFQQHVDKVTVCRRHTYTDPVLISRMKYEVNLLATSYSAMSGVLKVHTGESRAVIGNNRVRRTVRCKSATKCEYGRRTRCSSNGHRFYPLGIRIDNHKHHTTFNRATIIHVHAAQRM
ncbi:hypothetical protein CSKR_204044 [Clonorchis sinensis]|uniref:Uncharacterized protein n=1 Tax=Clonorchis sinensis TaxID=79923 RepID=A0A8T1MVA5_CLOSI|nr:hypothetical protein CSKR_204044 [Clonorchis sinensis]